MKLDLSNASPSEIQERFVLSEQAPIRRSCKGGNENLNYFCELDGQRFGDIELFNNKNAKRITWSRMYPLCSHLTIDELDSTKWVTAELIQQVGLDFLRIHLCDTHSIPEGLEGIGLGTLAHTLVARHLYRVILDSDDEYTTAYFDAGSIKPRLKALLHSAGVGDMIDTPCSLKAIQEKLSTNAQKIFGFTF